MKHIHTFNKFLNESVTTDAFEAGRKSLVNAMKKDFLKGQWKSNPYGNSRTSAFYTYESEGYKGTLIFSIFEDRNRKPNEKKWIFQVQLDVESPRSNNYGSSGDRARFGTHTKGSYVGKVIKSTDPNDYMTQYGEYNSDFIREVDTYLKSIKQTTGIDMVMSKFGFEK